jgi:hypothetical protein
MALLLDRLGPRSSTQHVSSRAQRPPRNDRGQMDQNLPPRRHCHRIERDHPGKMRFPDVLRLEQNLGWTYLMGNDDVRRIERKKQSF